MRACQQAWVWISLVLGAACFCHAEPPALTVGSSTDQILDRLHEVGKDLQTFTARVVSREADTVAQDTTSRTGTVIYQKRDSGDTRMRVGFQTRTQDGVTQEYRIEYVLDGPWLVERRYAQKQEITQQVLRPGEKINLLRLGEGPFPLPIGQTREDVYKEFEVRKVDPAKDDPDATAHLQLTPKAGTRLQRKFATIDVWVDLVTGMPRRVETDDPNGAMRRAVDLLEFKTNIPMSDKDFALDEVPADWDRQKQPYGE